MATLITTPQGGTPGSDLTFQNLERLLGAPEAVYPDLLTSPLYPTYPAHSKSEPAIAPMQLEQDCLTWQGMLPPPSPEMFRTPSSFQSQYVAAVPQGPQVIQDSKNLEALGTYLRQCPNGFHPFSTEFSHPIHQTLFNICKPFLESCQNWPLDKKIEHCEKAVAEIVYSIMGIAGRDAPGLVELYSKIPKFELLEIAVRNHLFQGMLAQQKAEISQSFSINQKFPKNLGERETALFQFVTKNYFFQGPVLSLLPIMYDVELINSQIEPCVQRGIDTLPLDRAIEQNEKLIADTLKGLQLELHSQCSEHFEYNVRLHLAHKLIAKQAEHFKTQYHQTGTITSEEFNLAAAKIANLQNGNGRFFAVMHPSVSLLAQTFELPMDSVPFVAVRLKIEEEKEAKLRQAETDPLPSPQKGLGAIFSRAPKVTVESRKLEVALFAQAKVATVNWAEKEWDGIMNPPAMPIPSAPAFELDSPTPPQDLLLADHSPFHIITDDRAEVTTSVPVAVALPRANPVSQPALPSSTPIPQSSSPIVVLSTPSPIEPRRIQATDLDIPLVSYVGLAFASHLRTIDGNTWQSLPDLVKKDVLRHAITFDKCQGRAEDIARTMFNSITKLQQQFAALSKKHTPEVVTSLSPDFVQKGRELLEIYYTEQTMRNPIGFVEKFKTLPKEPRFFQYVYEMAKAAGVEIPSWDHHFAENNWAQIGMIPLSVQALERCLHT